MIMERRIRFAVLALVCAISLLTGCQPVTVNPGTVKEETAHFNYRYASAEEGRQIILSNTAYFDALTQNDIDWKFRCTGKTLDEFKTFTANQIKDFTEEEKKALDATINSVEARLCALGIGLPQTEEIIFIKSDMEDATGAAGYTLGYSIYLSSFFIETITELWQGKQPYTPDYNEYFSLMAPYIVAHELFHCLSRNDATFRQRLYSLIGFTIMDHEVEFGPTVRNMLLMNPDVERYDNWAEFTINGEKRRCILVAVYACSFAEVAATDPGASFLYYLNCVLVPLDDTDTMIPFEQASDFYEVMGHNTDYILAADECMADNFAFLVTAGFNGHYEFWDDKLQFVPYQTPRLILNIHKTLQELYPKD